ncbi:MAG: right-handed parallel beta-helix repeat-containing protein [Candidatus Absconditabacterales bacterium]
MKKLSFKSLLSIATLALIVLTVGGIDSKVSAYTSDYYTGNYTPVGCNSGTMNVIFHTTATYTGADFLANTIYVFDAGTYAITPVVNFGGDCTTLVNSGIATFDFGAGGYFSAFGKNNILIDGIKINGNFGTLYGFALGNVVNFVMKNSEIKYTATNGSAVYFFNVSGSTLSNNVISNNNGIGIQLQGSKYNTITANQISNNKDGLSLQNTSNYNTVSSNQITNSTDKNLHMLLSTNNTFSNLTITNAKEGIYLDNGSNNNTFTNISQSNNNTGNGLYTNTASNNTFNGGYFTGNENGIYLNNTSNGNSFLTTKVALNTYGVLLSNASSNTFNLENNTNGIYINNSSNSNAITNTQVVGENNIFIYNGSNNIVTGGVFASASTTSTTANITLKNNQTSPSYTVNGAGLSGTYTGAMTGITQTLPITFSSGDGVKNIIVTYNNNNIYNDSISYTTYVAPPSGGGGGGGGGGGSPVCTTSNLVCTNGVRTLTTGAVCQGGNLGLTCTIGNGTGILPVGSIAGSTYSTELNNAYLWAYAHSITTMNTIQKANMGGNLIRSHMAKMISNFAITLGGFTPDTQKQCTFSDIGNQSAEMKFYIKLACQLGLMGVGIEKFDPAGEITRAQFGTILSRLIWGNTYEGGVKYYTNHLNALKIAGIMTQISTPTMKELRGYVMLMMKRTYEGGFLNN